MAIPEFILKKLIVPGSFRETSTGFQFKIMNSFAPATISRFSLRAGDKPIPPGDIQITTSGQPAISGTDVNPENSMPLSVGVEITVESFVPAGGDPVYVNALTKEVGEIDFCLKEGKRQSKHKKLKPLFFSYFHSTKKAELSIFPDQVRGSASPFILGQFVEHLERCVYDGIWTADGKTLRDDTLDLINQLNPPLIRYPGGNFASGYHWEDGIGPVEKRPTRHDAAWQAEESNQVGTDEFLAFCELIGTEPLLVVNDGSGSVEEAARWVAYCNSPIDTEQGARRAANGHPAPYNVKFWGVGNEVWGPWQIGTTTAQEYAKRAARFILAMKSVDPSVKIIAVGNSPLTEDPDDEAASWNRTILEKLAPEIDYLSWHIYQPEKEDWREDYDPNELYHAVCAAPLDIDQIIERVEKQINLYSPGKTIFQAIDEWNLWLPPREKNVSMHNMTYTLRDSLYIASTLITFFKRSQTVGMANLAQLVNVLPLIYTDATTATATAIFYPFVLFNQMQSNLVATENKCDTFNSSRLSLNMSAHQNVPYLDELATVSDDGKRLTLILVNRYPINRLQVHIHLAGWESKVWSALCINAPSPDAYNEHSHPNRVRISDVVVPGKKVDEYRITLKPCSVYFLEFELKKIERE